jgi:hypothetical protein
LATVGRGRNAGIAVAAGVGVGVAQRTGDVPVVAEVANICLRWPRGRLPRPPMLARAAFLLATSSLPPGATTSPHAGSASA